MIAIGTGNEIFRNAGDTTIGHHAYHALLRILLAAFEARSVSGTSKCDAPSKMVSQHLQQVYPEMLGIHGGSEMVFSSAPLIQK